MCPASQLQTFPHDLVSVGQFLLLADSSGARNRHYIFSESGELLDSEEWNRYSRAYAWNASTSRVYFFRDGISPNDLHFEEINQLTGEIVEEGDSPYHGDFSFAPPLIVSPNDELILTGYGDAFNAEDLTWQLSIGGPFDYGAWTSSNIVTLTSLPLGRSTVTLYNSSGAFRDEVQIDALAIGVFNFDEQIFIVTKNSATGEIQFNAPAFFFD